MQLFIQNIQKSLHKRYTEREIQVFAYMILEKVTNATRATLLANKDLMLNEQQSLLASEYVRRLQLGEPIQYILGETEFYGFPFKVNASVLIPRPETEELVEWIVEDVKHAKDKKKEKTFEILDIGTGSGGIAISLQKSLTDTRVSAMDISADAIELAQENAEINKVSIDFIQDDILNPKEIAAKWDIIVSNPPYIPQSESADMAQNVVGFEPGLALFVEDEDPLVFYKSIAEYAIHHLLPDGKLYVETHQAYAHQCKELFDKIGFSRVEVRQDLSGNDRMVKGEL